jgi:hypothetical protein
MHLVRDKSVSVCGLYNGRLSFASHPASFSITTEDSLSGISCGGVNMVTYFHVVPLTHTPSWRGAWTQKCVHPYHKMRRELFGMKLGKT